MGLLKEALGFSGVGCLCFAHDIVSAFQIHSRRAKIRQQAALQMRGYPNVHSNRILIHN